MKRHQKTQETINFCIANDTPVLVHGQGFKRLDALKPGDAVYRPDLALAIVQGLTAASATTLRLNLAGGGAYRDGLVVGEEQPLRVFDRANQKWHALAAGELSWKDLVRGWHIRYLLPARPDASCREAPSRHLGVVGIWDIPPAAPGRGVIVDGGGLILVGRSMVPVFAALPANYLPAA